MKKIQISHFGKFVSHILDLIKILKSFAYKLSIKQIKNFLNIIFNTLANMNQKIFKLIPEIIPEIISLLINILKNVWDKFNK